MMFTMSFWLLVSSMAYGFWVQDVLRRRDDFGKYARLVQELQNSDGQ